MRKQLSRKRIEAGRKAGRRKVFNFVFGSSGQRFERALIAIGVVLLVALSYVTASYGKKDWSDITTNLIADLIALSINALIVSHLLKRDRHKANIGRIRANAEDIREFFVCAHKIVHYIIKDGIKNAVARHGRPISMVLIRDRQAEIARTSPEHIEMPGPGDWDEIAAFFFTHATMNEHPGVRDIVTGHTYTTKEYCEIEAEKLSKLYRTALSSDGGFVDDDVISAMRWVNESFLFHQFKSKFPHPSFHRSWLSYNIRDFAKHMTILSKYYAPLMETRPSPYYKFIENTVDNNISLPPSR